MNTDPDLIPEDMIHNALLKLKSDLSTKESSLLEQMNGGNLESKFNNLKFTVLHIVQLQRDIESLNLLLRNAMEGYGDEIFGSFVKQSFAENSASAYLFFKIMCEQDQPFALGFINLFGPGKGMIENVPLKYRPILAIFLISHQGFRNSEEELRDICGDLVSDPKSVINILFTLYHFPDQAEVIGDKQHNLGPKVKILSLVIWSFYRVFTCFNHEELLKRIKKDKDYLFYSYLLETLQELIKTK